MYISIFMVYTLASTRSSLVKRTENVVQPRRGLIIGQRGEYHFPPFSFEQNRSRKG